MRSAWREINRERHGSVRACRPPATGVPRQDSDSLRRCGALATRAGPVANRPFAGAVFRNSPRRKTACKLGLLEPAAVGPSRRSGHTSLGKQGVRQQGSSHEASVVPNRIHGAGPFPGGATGRGECPGNLQRTRHPIVVVGQSGFVVGPGLVGRSIGVRRSGRLWQPVGFGRPVGVSRPAGLLGPVGFLGAIWFLRTDRLVGAIR